MTQSGHPCKRPGRYNLYLRAVFDGARLNKLCAEDLDHAGIWLRSIHFLRPMLGRVLRQFHHSRRAASGNGTDLHAYVRAVPSK